MSIPEKYWNGLKHAYCENKAQNEWEHFERIVHGMSDENGNALKMVYPEIPESLLELLKRVDGTYYRHYDDEEICFFFFGSLDDGRYPYYLFSSEEMLNQKDEAYEENFGDLFYYCREENDDEFGSYVDERIKSDGTRLKWLCFSDCMNNGGTSSLYIDFTPSEHGVKGQIVRFLHDPDELRVIANSFDEFLENIMAQGFAFINSDTVDWL